MKPRIKIITLGVDNLERSLAFYRDGMGLPTQGIVGTEFEDGAVVFFTMNDDLILALYPRTLLAKDAKVPVSARARRISRSGTSWPPKRTWMPSCSRRKGRERA